MRELRRGRVQRLGNMMLVRSVEDDGVRIDEGEVVVRTRGERKQREGAVKG